MYLFALSNNSTKESKNSNSNFEYEYDKSLSILILVKWLVQIFFHIHPFSLVLKSSVVFASCLCPLVYHILKFWSNIWKTCKPFSGFFWNIHFIICSTSLWVFSFMHKFLLLLIRGLFVCYVISLHNCVLWYVVRVFPSSASNLCSGKVCVLLSRLYGIFCLLHKTINSKSS